ncbi:TRAP transporter small permease [Amorphus sp. 3PC139-8]|uniref:TRAP transporter small permease n=1 Tax=Amorphus sp. 3PC139-8 TaxID=2735676 RepID=UPI00345CF520
MRGTAAFQLFRKAGALLCAVILSLFTGLVLYSVTMRYLFNAPPMWGEELPKLLFIWLIFIGAGFAYFAGFNIRMTAIIDRVPTKPRRVIELAMHLMTVGILLMILWYSVPIIKLTSGTISYATGLSDGWKFWALPVGAILLLINEVWRIWRLLKGHVDDPVALGDS